MSFFRRRAPARDPFDLETPLLEFGPGDAWRVRDACEGTQIFGAVGSGKTSGSGQAIAKAFLRAGFGGLVLTAKPDEGELWRRYCAETGRSDSLIEFKPGRRWTFNFLDYELRRPGPGAGQTHNLVQLFHEVMEAVDGGKSGNSDPFWGRAVKQLLRNAIDVLIPATGRLSLEEMLRFVHSAPQSPAQVNDPDWQAGSLCFSLIAQGDAKVAGSSREADFEAAARYWLGEFPALAEKTRSIVVTSFTGMAEALLRGNLRELFCSTTNLTPEHAQHGCVIVVDLPVKEYDDVGRFAQILFKRLFQAAVERRDVRQNPRPVFLWADEAHFFAARGDQAFQTTTRSSRCCTVYLTQNLPNYHAAMGGEGGKAAADALLGCLATKIFHANGEPSTNQWAAELFAKSWQKRTTTGSSGSEQNRTSHNVGFSDSLDYLVQPGEFTTLKRGGPEHGLLVEAILFQGGRLWRRSGTTALRAAFPQNR